MPKHLAGEIDTTDTSSDETVVDPVEEPVEEPIEPSSTRPSNTAASDPTTEWETVTTDQLKPGDTVRATNQLGTIIFGVISAAPADQYDVNIGGVGVNSDGWTFERVVAPVTLPDEQGWYATEDETVGLDSIFLLDDSGRWWALSQNGEFTEAHQDYVLATGNLVPLIRKNELIDNILARVAGSDFDLDTQNTINALVVGEA